LNPSSSGEQRLSIVRQCELLGLSRSTWYYRPCGETSENLALMKQIDREYTRTPFYGSRKLAKVLGVNRKRVQRLMRTMGIEAIGPKRRTTRPAAGHKVYPYLLRDVEISRPDQVWSPFEPGLFPSTRPSIQPFLDDPFIIIDGKTILETDPLHGECCFVHRGFAPLLTPGERIARDTSGRIPGPMRVDYGMPHESERCQYIALPARVRSVEDRRGEQAKRLPGDGDTPRTRVGLVTKVRCFQREDLLLTDGTVIVYAKLDQHGWSPENVLPGPAEFYPVFRKKSAQTSGLAQILPFMLVAGPHRSRRIPPVQAQEVRCATDAGVVVADQVFAALRRRLVVQFQDAGDERLQIVLDLQLVLRGRRDDLRFRDQPVIPDPVTVIQQ
jgi:uncharacterized protein YjhX (UPF0386 family)